MSESKYNTTTGSSGTTPPARPVKREPPRVPSPTPSCMTTITPQFRTGRASSPTPSGATVLFGPTERGQIFIKPMSAILDPDDQMSTISALVPLPSPTKPCSSQRYAQLAEDTSDWRYSIKTVGGRLKYVFENEDKYQDVTFEVEGKSFKEQIKAHKLILRIASPVFDRIFVEADASSQSSQTVIPVKDVEPEVFKRLLKYIYTDVVDKTVLNGHSYLPLLQAAKTYGVRQLYLECVQLLKKSISDEVAVELCEIAATYNDKLLLNTALDHIANKAFAIFQSDDFLKLSQENVLQLFTRNDLRIDEYSLFDAAVKWGKYTCRKRGMDDHPANLRKVMQALIPEIRFPLMRPDEFTLLVTPTNLLTSEEQVRIYQYLCVGRSKQSKLPPISFKTTPRLSKKTLDLESESDSDDYPADEPNSASTSPEQCSRLPSTSNLECMDVTTEGESETASIASACSDVKSKSVRLERSYSISSSSSQKRRKIEKSTSHRKSTEKSLKLNIDDLFGDGQKSVEVVDAAISLNSFISQLCRNEHRQEINKIKLMNVRIQDSKSLEGKKVYLPALKHFELQLQIDESISSIITDNAQFRLENYLFFDLSRHGSWSYSQLWGSNIDITVIINKVIVFRMSHETSHITLNKFSGASSVLKSLREMRDVKSFVYSNTQFKDKHFPVSLNRLVILGVVSSECTSTFIKKFSNLKELTIVSPAASSGGVRGLNLDTELQSKHKIRKLGLGNFKLHLEPTIRFYNIVTLSLWRITWESYFEEKFHHTFPKLQELNLIGPMKGTSKLFKNILKINSLVDILCWNCNFNLEDNDDFLARCGVEDNEKHSFVLKRKEGDKQWSGSKMKFKDFNKTVYSKFEYEYIYVDVNGFQTSS